MGAVPHIAAIILFLILLAVGLSGCAPTQSLERAGDGSRVYLDQLSDAVKAEERQEITHRLTQYVPVFNVGIGDEFKVFFDVKPKPTQAEYLVAVDDKLSIEFVNDPAHSTTVTVRPDGRISLAEIGSIIAAGRTADTLARQIQHRYGEVLRFSSFAQGSLVSAAEPTVTVNVTRSTFPPRSLRCHDWGAAEQPEPDYQRASGRDDFAAVASSTACSRIFAGELQHDIDTAYSALGLDLTVSLVPHVVRTGSTMVIGEVPRPGRIPLDRPHTVLMAVSQAGGVLPTGSMESVRLVYLAGDNIPHVRVINLNRRSTNSRLRDDMIVPDNSVIYVPATELAKANRMAKAIAGILAIQGWGFSGGIHNRSTQ